MKKLIQEIKAAKTVYTYCAITKHDGCYVQAVKSHLIGLIKNNFDESVTIAYTVENGNLYIG